MLEFLAIAERVQTAAFAAKFAAQAEARTVAGARAMRIPFDGTVDGHRAKGTLYLVQGDC